jgi:hypothetical protein
LQQAAPVCRGEAAIIEGYGVESSADINNDDLMNICRALEKRLDSNAVKLDRLRKQVIAAIGGWLRMQGKPENIADIKAIACRATKSDNFNRIPPERLRNVYNAFLNKQKDSRMIDELVSMAIYSQSEQRQIPN